MSKDIDVRLGRSRVLLVMMLLVFLLAFVAVVILQAPWFIRFSLALLLAGSCYYTLRQVLLLAQDAIIGLRSKRSERVWMAEFANQSQLRLSHLGARVFKSLVILQLENPVNQRRYHCFIYADSLSKSAHSELRALVLTLEDSGDH